MSKGDGDMYYFLRTKIGRARRKPSVLGGGNLHAKYGADDVQILTMAEWVDRAFRGMALAVKRK